MGWGRCSHSLLKTRGSMHVFRNRRVLTQPRAICAPVTLPAGAHAVPQDLHPDGLHRDAHQQLRGEQVRPGF